MHNLEEIYCHVDDFLKLFLAQWNKMLLTHGEKKRIKPSALSPSEVMTILILFHQSHYRTLKHFYINYVCQHLKHAFPSLVSYSQFVRLQKSTLIPLCAYLNQQKGDVTGISFIDSTSLAVCHNKRISRHKVFEGIAARGKTTMGWFYGFVRQEVVWRSYQPL